MHAECIDGIVIRRRMASAENEELAALAVERHAAVIGDQLAFTRHFARHIGARIRAEIDSSVGRQPRKRTGISLRKGSTSSST